jgi:hypothetical protein
LSSRILRAGQCLVRRMRLFFLRLQSTTASLIGCLGQAHFPSFFLLGHGLSSGTRFSPLSGWCSVGTAARICRIGSGEPCFPARFKWRISHFRPHLLPDRACLHAREGTNLVRWGTTPSGLGGYWQGVIVRDEGVISRVCCNVLDKPNFPMNMYAYGYNRKDSPTNPEPN